MQFKMKEVYNTRFLYLPYARDLTYLFSTIIRLRENPADECNVANDLLGQIYDAAKNNIPIEFDLADIKLSPDCSIVIDKYSRLGIKFIDTQSINRNIVLQENYKRIELDASEYVELPEFTPDMKIKDYITSLDKTVKYCLPVNDYSVYIPLTCLILSLRPSIQVLVQNHEIEFFKFVSSHFTLEDLTDFKEFYFTTTDGTIAARIENGNILTQQAGLVSFEDALTYGTLVPFDFGRVRTYDNPAFEVLTKDCISSLNRYRGTKKKHLEEVFIKEKV